MFIAIPLENKPSWRAPPWMTLLLIAVNCWVFFAWQMPEERAVSKLAERYAQSPLPAIELPAFVQHVQAQARSSGKRRSLAYADAVEQALKAKAYDQLYTQMWHDAGFRQLLLAGRVIRPGDPNHAEWKAARERFTPQEPQPFTARWSQNHDADAPFRPETWLTNTFLHGSVGHLLGNMLFLFLFGFTLELALGPLLYLGCYLVGGIGASAVAAWAYAGMGGLGLGASGAVAALMGMYVVLYRLKRIPFFYMLLFYFNYARWPALVMLPVWMGFELLQHLMGGQQVAYMAHFGGLVTGALLMTALMALGWVRTPQGPMGRPNAAKGRAAAPAELAPLVEKAQALTDELRMGEAARAWAQAARVAPRDAHVLQAWFDCARHEPASDGFHAAARHVFKLPAADSTTRRLLHRCYQTYLENAKPGVRISPATMQSLVRAFVAEGEWRDAENLARAVARTPVPPDGWDATLEMLASGLAKAGRLDAARAWLPELQRRLPQGAVTRWLAGQGAAASTSA